MGTGGDDRSGPGATRNHGNESTVAMVGAEGGCFDVDDFLRDLDLEGISFLWGAGVAGFGGGAEERVTVDGGK